LAGGKAGLLMKRNGSDEWLTVAQAFNKVSPSKFANVPIRPGDRIKITGPAGGGWGPPTERSRKMVEEDLLDGYITTDQAEAVYGLAPKGGRS
jgi:5-oxoprolinase (ATP-hydrolysing)/N-methylhydantoinase B